MLKRHGNFPYDSDPAYPDRPTPVMPPNPIQYSPPPPIAPAEPAPPHTDAPLPPTPPSPAASPVPAPPEIKSGAPKSPPRKARRRLSPLKARPDQSLTPSPAPSNESDSSRHARKCSVCNHPERDAIDDDLLNWIKPKVISFEFGIPERILRRHARATGLTQLRLRNCRSALGLIIERAMGSKITGDTVIRAIRATSCITESGEWVEQPKHIIYTFEHAPDPAVPPTVLAPVNENPVLELAPPASSDAVLIDRHTD